MPRDNESRCMRQNVEFCVSLIPLDWCAFWFGRHQFGVSMTVLFARVGPLEVSATFPKRGCWTKLMTGVKR